MLQPMGALLQDCLPAPLMVNLAVEQLSDDDSVTKRL